MSIAFLFPWTLTNTFLRPKNPLLRFLNFTKFEYSFLCAVSYVPILSVSIFWILAYDIICWSAVYDGHAEIPSLFKSEIIFSVKSLHALVGIYDLTNFALKYLSIFLADDICWFAVYDGHAGSRVSYHCSNHLLESISTSDEFRDALKNENDLGEEELMEKVKGGVLQGFLELDEKLRYSTISI